MTRTRPGGRASRKPGDQARRARGASSPSRAQAGFVDFVADQLEGLGDIEIRAMFGGHGIYLDGTFFGIVHKSRLFFRVTPGTLRKYEARGMKPFNPHGKPLATYYEVPSEVQDEAAELKRWARVSARRARGQVIVRRRRRTVP